MGSTGVLEATLDPSFAVGASNPTPIFDTTAQNGTATFALGAKIGVTLDAIQDAPSATYVFVHTPDVSDLDLGNLSGATLANAPFLYAATVAQNGGDVDVIVRQKNAAELGLNPSESAAFSAIISAAQKDQAVGAVLSAQNDRASLVSLYDQMVPDQGIGTFEALESATEKISQITGETPDGGIHVGGTSLWLQEVNQRVDRQTTETLGSNDKVFGLVGGFEKMGEGGGGRPDPGLSEHRGRGQRDARRRPHRGQPAGGRRLLPSRLAWPAPLRARGRRHRLVRPGQRVPDHRRVRRGQPWQVDRGVRGRPRRVAYELHFRRFYFRPEIDADYLYLDESAHNFGPGSQVVNISVAGQRMDRMSGQAILTFGAQYGHDEWFRPEIYGGYREVFAADFGDTVAQFSGGTPFALPPGDTKGGWVTMGLALKAGTELSYLALEGDAAFRPSEQRFDVFFVGRTMF